MKNSVILAILDGWGLGQNNKNTNPFALSKTPAFDYIEKYFPAGALQSSGISVGLPWHEPGSAEAGHLTIGTGRVVYQNYPKISKAIKDGSFFKNQTLNNFLLNIKNLNTNLHLVGLLSSNHIHSDYWHIVSLLRMAKTIGIKNVYLHLFGDGQDAPPQEAASLIKKLQQDINKIGVGKIASFSGRFYAMDRTRHWDRTQMVYDLLVNGRGEQTNDLVAYLKQKYQNGLSDDIVKPVSIIIGNRKITVQENDGLFFFNFQEDRIKQLFLSFIKKDFKFFPTDNQKKIFIASIVKYLKETDIPYIFDTLEAVKDSLSEALSKNGKIQLKIAETERYAHITYFFNGLNSTPFFGENRVLVPSFLPHQFKDHPEMKAQEITDRLLQALDEFAYDFLVVNYVNADVASHIGDFDIAIKAIQTIDYQIGRILKKALEDSHTLIITGSYGNIEQLRSPYTGEIETNRTIHPVPFYLVSKKFSKNKPKPFSHLYIPEVSSGMLSDIAPTILEILNINIPSNMEGLSLLDSLE